MRRIGRQHCIIDFTDSIFQLSNSAGQSVEVTVSFWVWYFPCRDIKTMAKKSFCTFQCFLTIRLFLALFKLENNVDAADDDKWHCFTIIHFSNQSFHSSMKKKRYICVVIFSIQFSRQLSYQSVLSTFSPSIFSLIAVEINLKKMNVRFTCHFWDLVQPRSN